MTPRGDVLILACGNPARADDGLGPALAEVLEQRRPHGVDVEADYQLTVEDAAAIAEHDVVIFADADVAAEAPFRFQAVQPKAALSFSSHSIAPAAVLALARDLFGATTRGYTLGIRGYEFGAFREGLSEAARKNLADATAFLLGVLAGRSFDRAARADADDHDNQATEVSPCKTAST